GQVVRSNDLVSAVLLMVALSVLLYNGSEIATFLARLMRQTLTDAPVLIVDRDTLVNHWFVVLQELSVSLLPLMGALLLASIAVNVAQVGFIFLPEKVGLDISHIDPMKGLGRIFSSSNVMRLVFGLIKIAVIISVAVWCLWGRHNEILALIGLEVGQIGGYVPHTLLWIGMKIGFAMLLIAMLDYGYQKWKFEKDLMMTTEEVKEEMKNTQGDPHVIARRKTVQRQMVMNRMKSTVPKADVIVTNPTELAIAIHYDYDTMPAPVVVAKGAGVLAQRIRRLGLENNIPIVERKELAQLLYKHVEVNQQVPSEQYAAVAEVLRYVYQLQGKKIPGTNRAA
ncbi:MAG TPA: EscU/YscU/HrcU family type III secretion system export apparatus switch protein, partial [Pirellulaceae bacterium]|nr:EscU/YscU/HrcU family type III secretion system export apparatus switch protein [Pirellulaceae bacterium]